ncbi:MAG: hypothetical protein IT342_06250, partial [Candidatus Melainabacteria bacterium]|nr:hypothetical protein [Candidatus Melainabacteria bacterium]
MSGQDVKTTQTTTAEALQDARNINTEISSDVSSAYQMFRRELDDIDTNVKDSNLKAVYQENLLRTLGE